MTLTNRRVIPVVAVDARHAACIIDIGIESIDRVLSSRSPIVVVVPTTTTTARMIGHSGGDPLCLLTSIHIHGVLPYQLHRGYGVLNIVYVCACEKRTTRDGTGGRSDRVGSDDSDDDSDVIIVVFMCKQCDCGGTVRSVLLTSVVCPCVSVCPCVCVRGVKVLLSCARRCGWMSRMFLFSVVDAFG